MRLVSWVRFTWNLKSLPGELPDSPLTGNYIVRRAVKADEKAVQRVIQTSLNLDSDWLDIPHDVLHRIETRVKEAFTSKEVPCLVFSHGSRIVGASALSFVPDTPSNLIGGPCILVEYRNRGFGTALLYESLKMLKLGGLDFAHGVTKRTVTSAKFVYTKFEGTCVEFDPEVELVS